MGGSKARRPPIAQRKEQITREIEKLESEFEKKTRRHFKTEEGLDNWRAKNGEKIAELREEGAVLEDPGPYNEIPLAIAAEELGLTLDEINSIAGDNLLEISTRTHYFIGSRITRSELERLHEVGAGELLRLANQELDEIFEDAIGYFHAGDLKRAEKAAKRIESRVTYTPYMLICELALELLKGEYENAISSIRYICRMDDMEAAALLADLGRVLRVMKLRGHGTEGLREQMLAITEGTKFNPFDKGYWGGSKQVGMSLDENQKHAMFLATAVKRALDRYKFTRQFRFYNSRTSEMRDEEFEGIIKDALYTALQAESTYYESAASKMYVDKLVASLPKWWVPAEQISLLPSPNKAEETEGSV
jgi:tetratricopeptide (TPR) repeat protein